MGDQGTTSPSESFLHSRAEVGSPAVIQLICLHLLGSPSFLPFRWMGFWPSASCRDHSMLYHFQNLLKVCLTRCAPFLNPIQSLSWTIVEYIKQRGSVI